MCHRTNNLTGKYKSSEDYHERKNISTARRRTPAQTKPHCSLTVRYPNTIHFPPGHPTESYKNFLRVIKRGEVIWTQHWDLVCFFARICELSWRHLTSIENPIGLSGIQIMYGWKNCISALVGERRRSGDQCRRRAKLTEISCRDTLPWTEDRKRRPWILTWPDLCVYVWETTNPEVSDRDSAAWRGWSTSGITNPPNTASRASVRRTMFPRMADISALCTTPVRVNVGGILNVEMVLK